MSMLDAKPVNQGKKLNPKLLPIAALLLVVLALLFLATPLIRISGGLPNGANIVTSGNNPATQQNNPSGQAGGNQFFVGGSGAQVQGGTSTPTRRFTLGTGIMGGRGGIFVYFIALLIALTAAVGMLFTKRWGQVLGIIMAAIYCLLGLVSLLPIILISAFGAGSPLSLVLGILRLLLALAVIVVASIPAKQASAPVVPVPPPAASN